MNIFDKTGALDRVEGDLELYKELIEIWEEDYQEKYQLLVQYHTGASFKQLSETAHSLKSAFGNLGAQLCHSICAAIEQTAKKQTLPDGAQIKDLDLQAKLFREAVKGEFGF